MTLPLGTDNIFVPINSQDTGSIIAFAMASNIYKEAMVRQNYMDITHKVKGISRVRQDMRTGTIDGISSLQ